jgi:energy-coupling factor transporter ATP-binding protein EcfA2
MARSHSVPATKQIMLAGFSGAGKTTFLAALWHVISEKGEVPTALTLESPPKEAEHLNALRDKWHRCDPVLHTELTSAKQVFMSLAKPDGTPIGTVVLPDLSGESFSAQWEQRQCAEATARMLSASCGVLLMIHPLQIQQPVRIRDRHAVVDTVAASSDKQSRGGTTAKTRKEWLPSMAGTDVQLVDLLQCMLVQRDSNTAPLRLALAISAWDLVKDLQPHDWVQQRLPLFHQYLASNQDLFVVQVYGISAQGGDYDHVAEELLGKVLPSDRITIEGPDCHPHDLTAPLKWLLAE